MKAAPFDHVAVALDGSDDARRALDVALRLAARAGARATLASVVPLVPAFRRHPDLAEPLVERLRAEARASLDEGAAAARAAGVSAGTVLLEGHPVEELVALVAKEKPALIALGTRGLGAEQSHLVGSVSHAIAQFSPVPALLVRPAAAAKEIRRVLVPVDGSEGSRRAAEWARELAKAEPALVTLLYVIPQAGEDVKFTVTRAAGQPFLGPLAQDLADARVRVEKAVEYGHPAESILRYARKHDQGLLVLGRVGWAGAAGFPMGGVTEKVLHHARSSVVVVP